MRVVLTGFAEDDNGSQFVERFSASVKAATKSSLPALPDGVGVLETAVHREHLAVRLTDGRIARINFMLPDDAMYPTRKSKPAPNPKKSSGRYNRPNDADLDIRRSPPGYRATSPTRFPSSSPTMDQVMMGQEEQVDEDDILDYDESSPTQESLFGMAASRTSSSSRPTAARIAQVTDVLPDKSEAEIVRALERSGMDVQAAINLLMTDSNDEDPRASAAHAARQARHQLLASAMASHRRRSQARESAPFGRESAPFGRESAPFGRAAPQLPVARLPPRHHEAHQMGRLRDMMRFGADESGMNLLEMMEQQSAQSEEVYLQLFGGLDGVRSMAGQRRPAPHDVSMGVVGSRLPTLRPSSEHQATPASDINTQWGSAWTFWDAPSGKFVRLGGMHSNLLAVGSDGALYCWPWSAEVGETVPYHRSEMLGLVGQEIRLLSTASYRASIVLRSGAVVTMADTVLHAFNPTGGLLACEHTAQPLNQDAEVLHQSVSNDVTVLHLADDTVLRFGFVERSELKIQLRSQVNERKSRSVDEIIRIGDTVALRACPAFRPGVIAFNPHKGAVGRLLDNAWDMGNSCRFELADEAKTVEEWQLDTLQVLDTGLGAKAGQVLKADGSSVAVYFPADHGTDVDDATKWKHSRLLNVKQLFKTTCSEWSEDPMLKTCVDNTPNRCHLPDNIARVLSVSVVDENTLVLLATMTPPTHTSTQELPTTACYRLPATAAPLDATKVTGGPLTTPLAIQSEAILLPGPTLGSSLLCVDNTLLALTIGKTQATIGPTINVGVASGVAYGFVSKRNGMKGSAYYLQSAICPPQELAEAVALGDMVAVEAILADPQRCEGAFTQLLDGRRNVLHVAAAASAKLLAGPSSALHESHRTARDVLTENLCRDLKAQLPVLLSHLDVAGRTPFQSALLHGAYRPAVTMVNAARAMFPGTLQWLGNIVKALTRHRQCCIKSGQKVLPFQSDMQLCVDHPHKQEAALSGQSLSTLSPLHHLLATPICTATRLGTTSIAQHVFECYTCELTEQTCVCLACAMCCHAGHDLAYSQFASTSYCDCKGHASCTLQNGCVGQSSDRDSLVQVLLASSAALATNPLGETILMTMLRQHAETALLTVTPGHSSSTSTQELTTREVREEEQARRAGLAQVAQSWDVLWATFGGGETPVSPGQLDQCVHTLLQPSLNPILEHVVLTVLLAVEAGREDALLVACSLVKAVVRVFVVYAAQDIPGSSAESASTSPFGHDVDHPFQQAYRTTSETARGGNNPATPIYDEQDPLCQTVRRVLRTFLSLALPELAEAADAILTPVRLGLVTPVTSAPAPSSHDARERQHRNTAYRHYRDSRDSRDEQPSAVSGSHALVAQQVFEQRESGGTSVFDLASTTRPPSMATEGDEDRTARLAHRDMMIAHGVDPEIAARLRSADDSPSAATVEQSGLFGWAFEPPDIQPGNGNAPGGSRRRRNAMDLSRRARSVAEEQARLLQFETHTSAVQLARVYRRVVRCLALVATKDAVTAGPEFSKLSIGQDPGLYQQGFETADAVLTRTWLWLATCMDGLEAQLQHGQATVDRMTPKHRSATAPGLPTATDGTMATYVLNLLRGHSGETQRSRPVVNVAATGHVAYVWDALMLYTRVRPALAAKATEADNVGRSFFSRTESIVPGGLVQESQLDVPLAEALPLARHPHALGPDSSRHDLFGDGPTNLAATDAKRSPCHPSLSRRSKPGARRASLDAGDFVRPKRPKLSSSPLPSPRLSPAPSSRRVHSVERLQHSWKDLNGWTGPTLATMSLDVAAERWQALVQLYVTHFTPTVGQEAGSLLIELAGFELKESLFWAQMEKLRASSTHADLRFTVERTRASLLLTTTIQVLRFGLRGDQRKAAFHPSEFRVNFEGELGEGNGVVRAFFAAFADAVTQAGNLPAITKELVGHLRLQQEADLRSSSVTASGRRERPVSRTSVLQVSATSMLREHLGDKLRAVCQHAPPPVQQEMLTAILVDVAIHSGYTKDLKEAERLGQEIASWPAHARDLALTGTDSLFGFFRQFAASPGKTSTTPTTRASKRRAPVRRPLDCTGVLFCPGNPGYFSFRPGQYYGQDPDFGAESSEEDGMVVVNAYRIALCNTIGRLAGTCLRQRDLFPLRFSRHVLKYLLGREVAFHDLAFFDPGLYEAQRQLLNDYTEAGDNFEDLDLCFNVKLRPEMGSADIELVPGGKDVAVTPSNVQDFVQRYARLLMIECVQDELDALKAGFLEVIPANLLTDLTAEDLRLLLNGRDHVDLQLLKAATQFKHECNDRELYKATQERFWRVVEGLPQEQQHNLIYFWMSIPSLPATQRGLVPQPVIVIRPQTEDLPTAATCSARLSLPAYASETVLRDKLLLAIATKSFGFI